MRTYEFDQCNQDDITITLTNPCNPNGHKRILFWETSHDKEMIKIIRQKGNEIVMRTEEFVVAIPKNNKF